MSDMVQELLFRSSDKEGVGWLPSTVVHVPAGLLHNAADEITRLRNELHLAQEWSARVIDGQEQDMTEITRLRAEVEKLKAARDLVLEEAARQFDEMWSASIRPSAAAAMIRAIKSGNDS